MIVTSRFSGYRGSAVLPGNYLRLELQDYNLSQVKQFIENWLTAVETRLHKNNDFWRQQARLAAGDLYRRIETSPALRELAVNPLMLQIIVLVHRNRNITLPERRVELYKECVDVLLENWEKAKTFKVLLSATEARQLLQPVALWMHSIENRREVSKHELLEFITPRLFQIKNEIKGEDLLKSWQERSGILKGKSDICFFHQQSFQEYLAAEEIRKTNQIDLLVKNFNKAWWRELTLLTIGLTNPSIFDDFIRALLLEIGHDGADVDFMLRCIDESVVKTEEPFVEALRHSKRFQTRYNALLGLEKIGNENAKVAIKDALDDKDQHIANLARNILAKLGEVPAEEKIKTITVVIKNRKRIRVTRIFNSVENNAEYILVPGGTFKFSVTRKETVIRPLYFSKYPVTNKLYRRFIDYLSGKSINDDEMLNLPLKQFAMSLMTRKDLVEGVTNYLGINMIKWADDLRSSYDDDRRFNDDNQPVVGLNYYAAVAYCHWLTELNRVMPKTHLIGRNVESRENIYRLPTEDEWEWAATGREKNNRVRKYPWGNEPPDETRANYNENVGYTTPVGSYPSGATPEGLMDMAGNIWEYCDDCYENTSSWYHTQCVLRGGSWRISKDGLHCTARLLTYPAGPWFDSGGFRVVCEQL